MENRECLMIKTYFSHNMDCRVAESRDIIHIAVKALANNGVVHRQCLKDGRFCIVIVC